MCAIQGAHMYFKGDYISYRLTSKQVDKCRSDFQLYSAETPAFLVSGAAALICCGSFLISKQLPPHPSSNITQQLTQEINWGFIAVKAQCMLRKKDLQADDIYHNWDAEVSSAHLLMVSSSRGEKNTDKTTAAQYSHRKQFQKRHNSEF